GADLDPGTAGLLALPRDGGQHLHPELLEQLARAVALVRDDVHRVTDDVLRQREGLALQLGQVLGDAVDGALDRADDRLGAIWVVEDLAGGGDRSTRRDKGEANLTRSACRARSLRAKRL